MRVLHVAAGLSSPERPHHQPFIKSQIDSLISKGVECDVYEIKSFRSKFEYFKSIFEMRNILLKGNYDIIHSHYSYCGIVSYYASNGTPLVLSLMGSDLLGTPTFNGKQTLRGKLDRKISFFAANRADHIIVKSKRMMDLLKCKTPVSVIPNGVNLELFKPLPPDEAKRKLGFNHEDFIVLFLGNKELPVKNYKLAHDAFKFFKNRFNDESIKFINPFGIAHQTVVDYMSAANVLLLTSFWEGSPNVIKEAMACNLPIISTDVGDVKEIIQNTLNCFIVDFLEQDIASKIEIIYRNKMRSNGRENVRSLSSDVISEKLLKIYQSFSV